MNISNKSQSASGFVLKVAINSPLHRSFDYLLPDSIARSKIKTGARVRVPFGKRELIGIVLGSSEHSEIDPEKLKAVLEVLDEEPIFDTATMKLYQWASRYYHFPLGQALQTSLPKAVRQGKPLVEKKPLVAHPETDNKTAALNLNPEQNAAVLKILESLQSYHCFLLEGITGSGKTEVYLQLITEVLLTGKQILVLVPEISLTPQTISRFQNRFDKTVVALHSGLSDRQKFSAWLKARNGQADIIIGTRSAIFTPLARPGLIIIDEEHDASYKQQDGFRYSARDLAIYRAQDLDIPVLLGSATPSLESLQNAISSRYTLLPLKKRAAEALLPSYRFIDLCGQTLDEGFSLALLEAIRNHLQAGNQVLIFINRRGFAPLLQCHDCGWTATCSRCESSYTLHQSKPELRCHHCDSQRRLIKQCPSCQSSALRAIGTGTERSESFLAAQFPDTPLLRIDRDTTRNKNELETIIDTVNTGASCILVGTQMLAKGHHFPGVTLVAILDADSGLFSSDFRGQERMGQLITQVSGRAGRGSKKGEVLIQTHNQSHPGLNALVKEGYEQFARKLLSEREAARLPPFSHHILLRAEASRRNLPESFLSQLKSLALQHKSAGTYLLGPMPAPMEKRAGRFRYQLLLQSEKRAELHVLIERLRHQMEGSAESRKIRWSIDVDPIDFT